PNLPAHINLAMQTAEVLQHPNLQDHLGYFLLGSTSPDIRVITRQGREMYHFTDLDFQHVGTGVETMFGAHPELKETNALDGPTRAFVAGYITHLLADESYIFHLFRPYFGNRDVFEDATTGRMLDRALQLDLDREVYQRVGSWMEDVEFAPERVNVEFLELEPLSKWRDWVIEVVSREFSWDRLRYMARRIAAGDADHPADDLVNDFLERMPQSLDQIYDVVPRDTVDDFKTRAVDSLVNAVAEYLD
ncbi:MAG: zinc dependent phospholipase C family protein, partial [SAR202 cluster bacterium]|nr:zinc dependent phospholipase C family protein [SAR202 cluster bacterium]